MGKIKSVLFLTVKYHTKKNQSFQLLPLREKIHNLFKNTAYGRINRIINGVVIATLTCVDIIEIVKYGAEIFKSIRGFFCESLEYNPKTKFVHDMVNERNKYK